VTPHLDPALAAADPKPFLGFSDNTNLLNWLWRHGVAAFHGGSTQLHLGAGPRVDDVHLRSLRAALLDGGELEITDPGESEDFGRHWDAPEALTEFGDREPSEPWTWAGPSKSVTGRTWGGCLEVLDQIALAGRLPSNDELDGAILLLETSERLTPPEAVGQQLRAYGERGLLEAVSGMAFARPVVSRFDVSPSPEEKTALRAAQRDAVLEIVVAYNPDAVVCAGVPFGHTRPQWILPYGGELTLDGTMRTVTAQY
jgi:muramoyltetrapeptide carboxypeptidase LdcA involved in peptidoglycan recycling